MKPSLQLRISQSLTMTPQLQQAIRLLQLSSIDLQTEIQEALESNPLLETESSEEATVEKSTKSDSEKKSDEDSWETDTSDKLQENSIDTEMVVDTQWEDWGYVSQGSGSASADDDHFEYQGQTTESLRDKIQWQLDMMSMSDLDRTIAALLVDSLDEQGYVKADLDEVVSLLNEDQAQQDLPDTEEPAITREEVEAVLHLIQSFDPPGIGARDLRECLLIQCKRFEPKTKACELAEKVLVEQFDALSSRNYKLIARKLKLSDEQLKEAVGFIQNLDPRPGNQLSNDEPQYVTPDVYVKKNEHGQWVVELNPENAPKLRINANYASLIKRANDSADNLFLKNNLQEARWFIKSLLSRNETLLKVAKSIVEKQIGFLEYGEEAMKPLVLHNIAEEVDMHESTISRVTTQKYMHTPRGVFELKYFFSSHVGTTGGGECSSTAIRAVIKKLIANENQQKPLSDNKIANLLNEQGIKVARRTVAKYREAMSIPPSNERKALL